MERKPMYSNRVTMNSSVYDFVFDFLTTVPEKDENKNIIGDKVVDSVEILMSPQHAKSLLILLHEQVKWYEENVGEIQLLRVPQTDVK